MSGLIVAQAGPAPIIALEPLAGLFLLLAFIVCIGLRQAWVSTLGFLFNTLADLLESVSLLGRHPLGFIASALKAVSHNVEQALGKVALKCEAGAVWLFTQMWHQLQWVGREIADLAHDTNVAISNVAIGVPLTVVKRMTATLGREIDQLRGIEHGLEARTKAALARLRVGIDRVENFATRTIPKSISGIRARVTHVERDVARLGKRVKSLEKAGTIAGVTALVAAALARLGLRWLRCGNMKRVGERICGVNPSWVDEFLAASILIAGTTSFVEFVEEAQAGFELGIEGLQLFIREL